MSQFRLLPIPFWSDDSPSTTATTCYEQYFMDDGWRANGWRISCRRVTRCAQQELMRHINDTGNNAILDQAVGCMRWLCGLPAFAEHQFIPSVRLLPDCGP